jgi:hypothetical protein
MESNPQLAGYPRIANQRFAGWHLTGKTPVFLVNRGSTRASRRRSMTRYRTGSVAHIAQFHDSGPNLIEPR